MIRSQIHRYVHFTPLKCSRTTKMILVLVLILSARLYFRSDAICLSFMNNSRLANLQSQGILPASSVGGSHKPIGCVSSSHTVVLIPYHSNTPFSNNQSLLNLLRPLHSILHQQRKSYEIFVLRIDPTQSTAKQLNVFLKFKLDLSEHAIQTTVHCILIMPMYYLPTINSFPLDGCPDAGAIILDSCNEASSPVFIVKSQVFLHVNGFSTRYSPDRSMTSTLENFEHRLLANEYMMFRDENNEHQFNYKDCPTISDSNNTEETIFHPSHLLKYYDEGLSSLPSNSSPPHFEIHDLYIFVTF